MVCHAVGTVLGKAGGQIRVPITCGKVSLPGFFDTEWEVNLE